MALGFGLVLLAGGVAAIGFGNDCGHIQIAYFAPIDFIKCNLKLAAIVVVLQAVVVLFKAVF